MTLQQWTEATHATVVEIGNAIVAYSHDTGLWQLDDYTVTGDAFGVVWLCHR